MSRGICPYKLQGVSAHASPYHLKPSSDGLIGFVIVDKATFDSAFLIWNPFTGQQKEISIPLMELRHTIGFGYDATIDDYKVVAIFSDDCADKIMVRAMNKCDDEWRTIYFAPSDRVVASQKGVDLDGTIWWTALRASDKSSVLMKFSLADEKLSTMAWPPDANPNPLSKLLYRLERYDGSLYMIDCHDDRHDEFYIWRIIKQGNETVWELPARRVPRSGCIYPMGFMRDGALLARVCGYNPSYACISSDKKELDIFELEEKDITWYSDYIVLDTETLISPSK